MYFSTLNNEELKYFHHGLSTEFSITLTEILASDNGVFMVETIRSGKLYRIYPLFYCKEIITSNKEDKVLSNQCIIASRDPEKETYYTFNTDNSEDPIYSTDETMPTAWNHELINKTIGDELTTEEFNSMVYIMRKHNHCGGTLDFEDTSTINGLYGSYSITDDGRLRNDTGFIINDDLKENPLTIKLTNPFFVVADYQVTFTVKSITGANIYEDSSVGHITEDTFTVSLSDDTDVALDLTSYSNDAVLLFQSELEILFNIPEIVNNDFALTLTTDKISYYPGEDIVCTATLTGDVSVTGYNIRFTLDNGDEVTVATDNEGVASATLTNSIPGSHIVKAEGLGLISQSNIMISRNTTTISLVPNKTSVLVDESLSYTVTLMDTFEDVPLANTSFKLVNGGTVTTLTTDGNGEYTGTLSYNNSGSVNIQAVYDGSQQYMNSESSITSITVNKVSTSLVLNITDSTTYVGSNDAYIVRLRDSSDNPISGASIKIYRNNNLLTTLTTGETGDATGNLLHNQSGTYTYKAVYDGTNKYATKTSIESQVLVNKVPLTITFSQSQYSGNVNTNIQVSGTVTDVFNNTVANASIILSDGTNSYTLTTNNVGVFSRTFNYSTAVNKTLTATYNETTKYKQASATANIKTGNVPTVIGFTRSPTTGGVDSPLSYTVRVMAQTGPTQHIPVRNATLRILTDNQLAQTTTTDSSGYCSFTVTYHTAGTHITGIYYDGSSEYASTRSSSSVTITE